MAINISSKSKKEKVSKKAVKSTPNISSRKSSVPGIIEPTKRLLSGCYLLDTTPKESGYIHMLLAEAKLGRPVEATFSGNLVTAVDEVINRLIENAHYIINSDSNDNTLSSDESRGFVVVIE